MLVENLNLILTLCAVFISAVLFYWAGPRKRYSTKTITSDPAPKPQELRSTAEPWYPRQLVRVVSYNVLSTGYANEMVGKPKVLDNRNRLRLLFDKLGAEVALSSVITLQEVSLYWAGELSAFFAERGYSCVSAPYGVPKSDYMGVLIAFPRNRFAASRALVEPLMAGKPAPPAGEAAVGGPWPPARLRENQVAHVRLCPLGGGRAFSVSAVHLPCEFWSGTSMRIYAALAAQAAREFAGGCPYVLCGDLNCQPSSSAYETLTTGTSARDEPPPEGAGDAWRAEVAPPLRSAYAAHLGSEPLFTTVAWRVSDKRAGKPWFQGTLDYVLLSPGWVVCGVLPLPKHARLLPHETEPSDHHLVGAELALD
jgi:endonuclease/exonuclease/phosphatase family metal-dependent hydrolase